MQSLLKGGFLILITAVVLSMAAPGFSDTEVFISSTKNATKISMIIPDFIKEGGFDDPQNRDKAMADILADDLNFSGLFDAKRVKEVKGDPSSWASLDVQDIAQGSYTTDGREIQVSAKVVDAKSGAIVFDRKYPDALRVMREKVHQMADEIIFQLTGEKGISQTNIAFVSDMTGSNELYVSDYDGHNVFRMTRDEGTCLLPGWSPSGSYITYTSYKRMNPDLWWVSSSGKSRGILSFFPGINAAASWSPDGERIALSLSKDGNSEIYTMHRDATGLKRLTYNPGIDTSPTWAPNGREIAFNSDRAGSPQIYVMDSDGGNVRRISYQGKYNASPAWSPNGDRIAYVSREGNLFNIFMMDPNGENVVRLTWNKGNNENPSWSPDGRHIVFSSTRSGTKSLYTMDPNGENVRRLNIPGNAQTPAWSPRLSEIK
ncbi:MAG: Tol-Pal system beta propeller repeat protein TolB [Nitrospirota bacterium]